MPSIRKAPLLLVALLLAVPLADAKGLEPARAAALEYLQVQASADPTPLAANIAEAVQANGLDASQWPAAPSSIASRIDVPGPEAPFIQLLRPLHALGQANDPRSADLLQRVRAGFDGTQFGSASALNDDAYAILALHAAGVASDDPQVQAARAFLMAHRNADGGWGWAINAPSGVDMTGIVTQAVETVQGLGADIDAAVAFVRSARDGEGFAEAPGGDANCESTVWAIKTLARAIEPPDPEAWWFLLRLQQPDGGFAHAPGGASDLLCTTEVTVLLGAADRGAVPFALPRSGMDPRMVAVMLGAGVAVATVVGVALVRRLTRLRQP